MTRLAHGLLALTLAACVLGGCTAQPTAPPTPPPVTPAGDSPTLRTLSEAELPASPLELGTVTAETENYTTTAVTYASGGATTTGALSIPLSDGPHPGLVLVHGVVNPEIYVPGSGLAREQDYFAKAGYVVLSLDLRSSSAEPTSAAALGIDMGSTLDVLSGIRALQSSELPTLDETRMGLLGHSLGGLLTLNTIVTRPELVDAAVALAPASTDPNDNVGYLTTLFGGTPTPIIQQYGTPEENPEFWRDISPLSLLDRAEAPVLVMHGTDDEITPLHWSRATEAAWADADRDLELVELDGEGHVFQTRWEEAMMLAATFLTENLD